MAKFKVRVTLSTLGEFEGANQDEVRGMAKMQAAIKYPGFTIDRIEFVNSSAPKGKNT
jgi:hypothetical protein